MKRIVVLGGGTFSPIRNHLSLCAPAFGSTVKKLHKMFDNSELVLTKMVDSNSELLTNEDVSKYIDTLLEDKNVGTIILNIAFCDYTASIGTVESGMHAERLKTSDGVQIATLLPDDKVISKIRRVRPDIFLVGFKTTTNKTSDSQFEIALKMMKATKCNLVLANDTVTRNNMIITPEETVYCETTDRDKVLKELYEITSLRNNLTYGSSNLEVSDDVSISETTNTFQQVIKFLIENGGFIENNGNGFTPGHFCQRIGEFSFLSSQRKVNHNDVYENGLTKVEYDKKTRSFKSYGSRKPSVGSQSQWLMLEENSDYDCIIHTHNPLKSSSKIPVAEQRPFQCGSLECGLNTTYNLKEMKEDIKAVYLDKHGVNILFKSTLNPDTVINFIKDNIELGTKTK